ncbi:hypothetical protein C0991_012259, partial [Blastosporella zonata]
MQSRAKRSKSAAVAGRIKDMMYQFELKIKISESCASMLSKDMYSLCLKKYLDSDGDGPTANMVAGCLGPGEYGSSDSDSFQWNPEYLIGATKTPYKEGGTMMGVDTDLYPIRTTAGNALWLTSWNTAQVGRGNNVPPNSFQFLPGAKMSNASCVVYMKSVCVDGSCGAPAPFYMSSQPAAPQSMNNLTPCEMVCIKFVKSAQIGTMTTSSTAYDLEVDLTQDNKQMWHLFKNADGKAMWERLP